MTPQEAADRFRTCVALGSVDGAVELMRFHGNDVEMVRILKASWSPEEEAWAKWGCPGVSVLRAETKYSNHTAISDDVRLSLYFHPRRVTGWR